MSNPIMENLFKEKEYFDYSQVQPMTVNGVINKLSLMTVLMFLSGGATWYQFIIGNLDKVQMLTIGGAIIGFVMVLIASFARKTAQYTVPIYAFAEGAFLAGISCYIEAMFPGVVVKAVALTFLTFATVLALYATKVIQVTERTKGIIISMTFALMIFYLITFVLSFFNVNMPLLYGNSPISIGFSIFVCILAASNLLIDFDFIEKATQNFYPKEYEWTGALGIMVTLVWLYIEILRLLSKLSRRD